MKKVLVLVFCVCLALSVVGCKQQENYPESIEGDVPTVIKECQGLPEDADVKITVSGQNTTETTVEQDESGYVTIMISADGNYDEIVFVMFEDPSDDVIKKIERPGEKTYTGKLAPDMTTDSSITITECSVK